MKKELYRSKGGQFKKRFLIIFGMKFVYLTFNVLLLFLAKKNTRSSFELQAATSILLFFFIFIIIHIPIDIMSVLKIKDIILYEDGVFIPFKLAFNSYLILKTNDIIIDWPSIKEIKIGYRGLLIYTFDNKEFLIPHQYDIFEIEKIIKSKLIIRLEPKKIIGNV